MEKLQEIVDLIAAFSQEKENQDLNTSLIKLDGLLKSMVKLKTTGTAVAIPAISNVKSSNIQQALVLMLEELEAI